RFYASPEALGHDSAKQRIAVARGNETAHNRLFDTVRGYGWPARTPGVRFAMVSWTAGPAARAFLAVALEAEHALNRAAARVGDCDTALVWAGEAVDLIHNVENAAALVAGISAEA
ncbi:MAG: nitronate monooxygenase, partial [Casimicrobiaceae bacterium]